MKEIEVKILDVNPMKVRKVLSENGARFVKRVNQVAVYYGGNQLKNEVLRIRKEGPISTITYKALPKNIGKRASAYKVAEEIELEIGDFDKARKMFKLCGFKEIGKVNMRREYFKLGGCSVEIIKIKGIPHYLEIEGKKSNILKVAKKLGFSRKDFCSKNVFEVIGYYESK